MGNIVQWFMHLGLITSTLLAVLAVAFVFIMVKAVLIGQKDKNLKAREQLIASGTITETD